MLVFGLNWMGDVIMSLPALHELVRIPSINIDIVTRPHLADLYRLLPGIHKILPLDTQQSWWRNLTAFKRLRRQGYDGALVLPNSFQSALSARLCGPIFSLGYSGQWRDLLLSKAVPRPQDYALWHESRLHLHLTRLMRSYVGVRTSNRASSIPPEVPSQTVITGPSAPEAFSNSGILPHTSTPHGFAPLPPLTRFFQNSVTQLSAIAPAIFQTPYVVVAPGAAFGAAKRWHPEKFAAVADRLAREFNLLPVITGAASEVAIANQVTAGISRPSLNLTGKTSLRELMALLANARLLLANDSGTMHLGAALSIPVVVPVGSTDMRRTGPLTAQARLVTGLICDPPCRAKTCPRGDHRCMVSLSAEPVFSACVEVLTS